MRAYGRPSREERIRRCLVCGAVLVRRPAEKRNKFLGRQFCGSEHFRDAESDLHEEKCFQKFVGNRLVPEDQGAEARLYGSLVYEDVKLKPSF